MSATDGAVWSWDGISLGQVGKVLRLGGFGAKVATSVYSVGKWLVFHRRTLQMRKTMLYYNIQSTRTTPTTSSPSHNSIRHAYIPFFLRSKQCIIVVGLVNRFIVTECWVGIMAGMPRNPSPKETCHGRWSSNVQPGDRRWYNGEMNLGAELGTPGKCRRKILRTHSWQDN